jgi:hypothetical protein
VLTEQEDVLGVKAIIFSHCFSIASPRSFLSNAIFSISELKVGFLLLEEYKFEGVYL